MTGPTVYSFQLTALNGAPLDLSSFRGRPMLIVNTASKCGFTPQYAGLEALWKEWQGEGLVVLGVPSNDFGAQEPGSAIEIETFCRDRYGVTFPMAAKVAVRGPNAAPLFKWLARGAGLPGRPWWNFTKYLVARDGRLADWFFCATPPDAGRVRRAIERVVR
ncbi:MAG: glutathione peroxidase [Rhodospirillaceae bacterium]